MILSDIKLKFEELHFKTKLSPLNFLQRSYRLLISKEINKLIPNDNSVLDVGCGTGYLTNLINMEKISALEPNINLFNYAKNKYKNIKFYNQKAEDHNKKYDYIILSDTLSYTFDLYEIFNSLKKNLNENGKTIITIYNPLFKPLIDFIKLLKFIPTKNNINWLTPSDIFNFLYLTDWEVIKFDKKIVFPFNIPFITSFINKFFEIFLPFLCLKSIYVCKPKYKNIDLKTRNQTSLSIIIPARNEEGNIEQILKRFPLINNKIELIFVEGNSTDNTWREIQDVSKKFPSLNVKFFQQPGSGKYDAVKFGISKSNGEFFLILDSDMTVPPEEIKKFYEILNSGKAEMVNGVRLVYPLERDSMQYLNFMANKFFSIAFSWIFRQRISDTLCGTKGMSKNNYLKIINQKNLFKLNDPFGDFELIFGAYFLNLKIVDIPIRYQKRYYGSTNIRRFFHGTVLLKILFKLIIKIKIN